MASGLLMRNVMDGRSAKQFLLKTAKPARAGGLGAS